MAAAQGIGAGIGSAIREARNAKRINQWHEAVIAKSEEADELLAEFDRLRKETLGPYAYLSSVAVENYVAFKQEHREAFDR